MAGVPCACHGRIGCTGRCRRRASPGSARYAPERELGGGTGELPGGTVVRRVWHLRARLPQPGRHHPAGRPAGLRHRPPALRRLRTMRRSLSGRSRGDRSRHGTLPRAWMSTVLAPARCNAVHAGRSGRRLPAMRWPAVAFGNCAVVVPALHRSQFGHLAGHVSEARTGTPTGSAGGTDDPLDRVDGVAVASCCLSCGRFVRGCDRTRIAWARHRDEVGRAQATAGWFTVERARPWFTVERSRPWFTVERARPIVVRGRSISEPCAATGEQGRTNVRAG